MSLTEKSRSAIFQGLSQIVEEEALEEMLSFFPARDVEEPVTKEFLRSEMMELELRLTNSFRLELRAEIGDLRDELRGEFNGGLGSLRTELKDGLGELRGEMRNMLLINIGTLVAFAAVIITAVRL